MSTGETASARALALLWGGRDRGRRGPKPSLDLDRIVAAAIGVADADGLGALSMRRVAAELDVGVASLYTYVPGRYELLALMLDAVAGYSQLPHTFPGDWRSKLTAWAQEDRAIFREHPWVLQVASDRPVPGPNLVAWLDSALAVLDGLGLDEADKVAAISAVDSYVRGAAWTQPGAAPGTRPEMAGTPEEQAELARWADVERFPALTRALSAGVHPDSPDNFDRGLRYVLDGIEALVEGR